MAVARQILSVVSGRGLSTNLSELSSSERRVETDSAYYNKDRLSVLIAPAKFNAREIVELVSE